MRGAITRNQDQSTHQSNFVESVNPPADCRAAYVYDMGVQMLFLPPRHRLTGYEKRID